MIKPFNRACSVPARLPSWIFLAPARPAVVSGQRVDLDGPRLAHHLKAADEGARVGSTQQGDDARRGFLRSFQEHGLTPGSTSSAPSEIYKTQFGYLFLIK